MLTRLQQRLGPPPFKDEEQNRVARTLFMIQMTLIATALIMSVVMLSAAYRQTAASLLLGCVFMALALWLNRRGHTRSASYLVVSVLLILVTFLLLAGQGVHDIAITLYPVIIIIASLLLARRAFLVVMGVMIGSLGVIVLTEMNRGVSVVEPALTGWIDFAILSSILILAAITVRFLTNSLVLSLQRARQNEQALAAGNAQLRQEIIERNQAEAAQRQSEAILAAVAQVAQHLLQTSQWWQHIHMALARLGEASGATHVYVFENQVEADGILRSVQRFEWVRPGLPPESGDSRLQNFIVFQPGLEDWSGALLQGEPFYSGRRGSTEYGPESFNERGIKTLLDVPIFVEENWWGIIGFDDCENELAWSQVEIDALRTAAGILGAAIQRQRIEARLREREERYRLISEVMSDYTFSTVVDMQGAMHLNWVAGAFENITGYTYEHYVARGGWRTALHPEDVEQDARDLAALQANQPVITEVRTITKDGAVRWVRVYAHPVWNETEARLGGIYGAVQDITERKQVEAEREALIDELEARNAELERFTYTVSHDLKAPLITIRGFLGFVEQDARTGDWDRLVADLARITAATDKMRRLLDELLELSRIGRMLNPPERAPFAGIVQEALQLVQGRLEARGVQVDVEADLPEVRGDWMRLVEVVQNLVDNACKFMGEQAAPRITIGCRGTDVDGRLIVYVQDNGIGIEPPYQEKIFGLFDKLDPRSEGTGIGLALVKRIVEVHGGRIWVESEGAKTGSTFYFTLPVK